MILNTYSKNPQAQYGAMNTSSVGATFATNEGVTLQDVLDCCQKLILIGHTNETMNFQLLRFTRSVKKTVDENTKRLNNLYSAIRDIRKEQLRGRRDPKK